MTWPRTFRNIDYTGFAEFLSSRNYVIHEPVGEWEVVRVQKRGDTEILSIYENNKGRKSIHPELSPPLKEFEK